MQPLDQYPMLLRGIPRREAEIKKLSSEDRLKRRNKDSYPIKNSGDALVRRWQQAITDQEVAIIERYGCVFIQVYELIVLCPPPIWEEYETEARRLTPVLAQYYQWLAALPNRLTAAQLETFQQIDLLLRARFYSLEYTCLSTEDKQEVETIATAVGMEIEKTHAHLIPNEPLVKLDGWLS